MTHEPSTSGDCWSR